ncbi:MAG: TfoX/Sxy family protein [Deltaproteobacteria bacterium]|jgi:TfoX/Sxy family transcriptional regulator of competence genes|nr:TfoX/Sxy family protein [Deltaproteobacteria bacterium]
MPFSPTVAEDLRAALLPLLQSDEPIDEKRMFGGLALLLHGHMLSGVIDEKIVLRINPAELGEVMGQPGVGPMDFTGRPMKGWLYLRPPASTEDLGAHLARGLRFVRGLPPKAAR